MTDCYNVVFIQSQGLFKGKYSSNPKLSSIVRSALVREREIESMSKSSNMTE